MDPSHTEVVTFTQWSIMTTHHQCSASSSTERVSQTDENQTTPPSLLLMDGSSHPVMRRMTFLQEYMSLMVSDA